MIAMTEEAKMDGLREEVRRLVGCAVKGDNAEAVTNEIMEAMNTRTRPVSEAEDARKKLTPEYLAMTPLQKWETLTLHGLLGTDEPWIADMRETLRALSPPADDGLADEFDRAADRLSRSTISSNPMIRDIIVTLRVGRDALASKGGNDALGLLREARLRLAEIEGAGDEISGLLEAEAWISTARELDRYLVASKQTASKIDAFLQEQSR